MNLRGYLHFLQDKWEIQNANLIKIQTELNRKGVFGPNCYHSLDYAHAREAICVTEGKLEALRNIMSNPEYRLEYDETKAG